MKLITSQKGFATAKRELTFIDAQLADLKTKREAALAGFAQAEQLLRDQRGEIASGMQAWELRRPDAEQADLEAASPPSSSPVPERAGA